MALSPVTAPHNNEAAPGRRYPSAPVAGVGALIFHQGKLLLVQRGKEPLRGWWSLPGGAIELGETALDALRREIEEETGLIVEPLRLVEIFERIQRDDTGRVEFHYVVADWICQWTGGQLRAASDAMDARWVSREEIHALPVTSGTLEIVLRHWVAEA